MNQSSFPFLFHSPSIEKRLVAIAGNVQYEWFTPWCIAEGVDSVRPVLKNIAGSTNFVSQIVIEWTPVRSDNPSTTLTLLGSALTGNGATSPGSLAVSSQTSGAMLFRLGIAYNSNTSGMAQADVSLQAAWNQLGALIDKTTVQLEANDTGSRIAVLSRWFPAIYASYLKVAWVAEGLTGGNQLQFRIVTQTADTSVETPNAWDTTFHAWKLFSSFPESNTGDLAFSPGNSMWARVGVASSLVTGTTFATGSLAASVCARI